MLKKIKAWYEGKYIPYENSPDSPIFFFGGTDKRHWTARIARILVEFYLEHWKWLWSISVASGIAILKLLCEFS